MKTNLFKKMTKKLLKKDISIFYFGLDFLTIKLQENIEIMKTLRGLCENSTTYYFDIGFKLEFDCIICKGAMTILRLLDNFDNRVGLVRLKNIVFSDIGEMRKNWNVQTNIEFTGDFFKLYPDYLNYFIKIFQIDINRPKNITRYDYCVDIAGLSVEEYYKTYLINKFSIKKSQLFLRGSEIVGFTKKTDRCELGLYDKRLDILDKNKYKNIFGIDNPYKKYIDFTGFITRFEYRALSKTCRESKASVNYALTYGQTNFISYIKRNFYIDFNILLQNIKKITKQSRENLIVNTSLKQKLITSKRMLGAYCDNIVDLSSKDELFKLLYLEYGRDLYNYGVNRFAFRDYPF